MAPEGSRGISGSRGLQRDKWLQRDKEFRAQLEMLSKIAESKSDPEVDKVSFGWSNKVKRTVSKRI